MRQAPRILLTAGEPSGDKLGAGLARALRARRPDIELYGMGGPQMEAAGVRLIQQMSEVSVVGLLEVFSHLPVLRRAMARLAGSLNEERPDLHVPIDFPDFNLRLTARSNRAGVPVVYFVSPQIWAWRRGRVRAIRRLVRRMLVLFPFEIDFYERAGVPVSFVGHPMAEERTTGMRDRAELCRIAGLDPRRRIVALLPGSREGEVSRLLPILIETVRLLERDRRGLQYLVPLAPGLSPEVVERQLIDATGEFVVHAGDFPEILTVCEAGLVAAGTASLEAAVVGLPMAVFYRMRPFSHLVGKLLVQLDDVALPNLIAGQRVVPELIQGESRPELLAAELGRLLDDPAERERMRAALRDVQRRLGGIGVYERAADAILEEIEALPAPEVAAPPLC